MNGAFTGIQEFTHLVQAFGSDAAGQDADAVVPGGFEAGQAVLVPDQKPGEKPGREQRKIARHHEVLAGDPAGEQGLDRPQGSDIGSKILEALMARDAVGIPEQQHPAAEGFEHVPGPFEHASTIGKKHARLRDSHAGTVTAAEDGTGMRPGAVGGSGDHGSGTSVDRGMEAESLVLDRLEKRGIP